MGYKYIEDVSKVGLAHNPKDKLSRHREHRGNRDGIFFSVLSVSSVV
jgi:hypothetical protein